VLTRHPWQQFSVTSKRSATKTARVLAQWRPQRRKREKREKKRTINASFATATILTLFEEPDTQKKLSRQETPNSGGGKTVMYYNVDDDDDVDVDGDVDDDGDYDDDDDDEYE
jgi:hypothetical protein